MNHRFNLIRCLLILILSSLIGCGGGEEDEDPLPPISVVFTLQAGDEITVAGFVTVTPGAFASSSPTGDVGFAIQDSTGSVFVEVDPGLGLDLSGLKLGNLVEVRGVVGDLNLMVTLTVDEAADVVQNGFNGFLFFPQELQTADIDLTSAAPELESEIVTLSGAIQLDPGGSGSEVVEISDLVGPIGWNLWLDDGSGLAQTFWHTSANLDPTLLSFLNAGTDVEVTGFLNRDDASYEVFPRGNFDISLSIPDARAMTAGDTVLVRGVIRLPADALAKVGPKPKLQLYGEHGFSLHEENGSGIFVSITDPNFTVKNLDGNPMTTENLGALVVYHSLGVYETIRVHVEGELLATTGTDKVIVPLDGGVRLISANIADPPTAVLATGGITSGDLGRIVTSSGDLESPPTGDPYPAASGWRSVDGGYRARIDDGSGPVNVFLPWRVIDPFPPPSLPYEIPVLTDLLSWPISIAPGEPLSVTGFLRHSDGEFEIVVLYNQPGFIQ